MQNIYKYVEIGKDENVKFYLISNKGESYMASWGFGIFDINSWRWGADKDIRCDKNNSKMGLNAAGGYASEGRNSKSSRGI